jgi:hypothetical protein
MERIYRVKLRAFAKYEKARIRNSRDLAQSDFPPLLSN